MSKNRGQTLDRLMGDGDTGVAKLTQHGRRYQSDQQSEYGNDNEQFRKVKPASSEAVRRRWGGKRYRGGMWD